MNLLRYVKQKLSKFYTETSQVDEKQNQEPKLGDIYLCLDTTEQDIYYRVIFTTKMVHSTGEIFITLEGVLKPSVELTWPLLFFDMKFVKVNETTVQILFGKGDKNGTTDNDQKS